MKGLRTGLYFAGIVFSGCMVGPDYKPPEVQVPSEFSQAGPLATASAPASQPAASQPVAMVIPGAATLDQWWQPLNDPMLDALIAESIDGNLDLQVAAYRVLEARFLRRVAVADLLPQINSGGGYSYSGSSLNARKPTPSAGLAKQVASSTLGSLSSLASGLAGGTADVGGTSSNPLVSGLVRGVVSKLQKELNEVSTSRDANLFQSGFDASWEIDIFGGLRRSVQAAEADIEVTQENLYAIAITLVSEVARNYIEARGYQKRLAVLRQNIGTQQETLELTRVRFKTGLTNELDVAQAATQLATTRSSVPTLEILHNQSIHRLAVLLGLPPGALLERMNAEAPIPTAPPAVPLGLPSELLRRRPDIRQAERTVAAETARIGVAVAQLYPRFSITGSFGSQTYDMQRFLDGNSLFWSVGPSFSWPIFQGGRLRANVKVTEARQMQALIQYRITILTALEEVENTLVAYRQDQLRYQSLQDAVTASHLAVDLSTDRYRNGLADFLSVLESQRSLYLAQDQLIASEADVVADYIALNKALGGGWQLAVNSEAVAVIK